MSYVRPAAFAGALYPLDYRAQIIRGLAQARTKPQPYVRLLFTPFSRLSEILQVCCEAYAAVEPSAVTRVLILCSGRQNATLQTPFARFALPDRHLSIVEVSHAREVGCVSETACIESCQAEMQLLFLSCVLNLQKTELFVFYAGTAQDVSQIVPLVSESTLVVCAAEFCRIGMAYGFLPKRRIPMGDYVFQANEALLAALGANSAALSDALRAMSLPSNTSILSAARVFKALGPLYYRMLRQALSCALNGPLDSAKSYCAAVGYEGEVKAWTAQSEYPY